MLRRALSKLKQMAADGRDSWMNPSSPVAGSIPPAIGTHQTSTHTSSPSASHPSSNAASIHGLREQLIGQQLGESVESQTGERVRIVRAGLDAPSSTERRSFTEDGLSTQTERFFVQTSEGRFIRGEELHGGGQCMACGGLTGEIFFCAVCRLPFCFSHSLPWETSRVCEQHHRQLMLNLDLWAEEERHDA